MKGEGSFAADDTFTGMTRGSSTAIHDVARGGNVSQLCGLMLFLNSILQILRITVMMMMMLWAGLP